MIIPVYYVYCMINDHFRNLNWRYLPYIRPMQGLCQGISHWIWAHMVQYIHFRILEFPLQWYSMKSAGCFANALWTRPRHYARHWVSAGNAWRIWRHQDGCSLRADMVKACQVGMNQWTIQHMVFHWRCQGRSLSLSLCIYRYICVCVLTQRPMAHILRHGVSSHWFLHHWYPPVPFRFSIFFLQPIGWWFNYMVFSH